MGDNFADGPLCDVDDGGAARIAWWSRIDGGPLDAEHVRALDDRELWTRVATATAGVVLWHGPHPADRVFALRACFRLQTTPERVHEVAYPTPPPRRLAAFFDSVAIRGADAAVSAWDQRRRVDDVASRAKRWEELRARAEDCLRVLDGDAILEVPVTYYDGELVDACNGHEWTDSRRVIGNVLAEHPTNHRVLCWRVRELLRIGVLRGRGAANSIWLPTEIRRVE